jgi:hypothetical protein
MAQSSGVREWSKVRPVIVPIPTVRLWVSGQRTTSDVQAALIGRALVAANKRPPFFALALRRDTVRTSGPQHSRRAGFAEIIVCPVPTG